MNARNVDNPDVDTEKNRGGAGSDVPILKMIFKLKGRVRYVKKHVQSLPEKYLNKEAAFCHSFLESVYEHCEIYQVDISQYDDFFIGIHEDLLEIDVIIDSRYRCWWRRLLAFIMGMDVRDLRRRQALPPPEEMPPHGM